MKTVTFDEEGWRLVPVGLTTEMGGAGLIGVNRYARLLAAAGVVGLTLAGLILAGLILAGLILAGSAS